MTALVIAARVLLAGVFAVAGVAKLMDRSGTRRAVVAFGAPERSAGALAIGLPLAELCVALLLVPAPTAAYGAIGALALLTLFTAAIAWSLARGRTPDCHCFGQLHSAPAGRRTLARNAALLMLAVLVLVGSIASEPASAVAWIGDLSGAELLALVSVVISAVVLAVGGVAFMSLLRSYGRVLVRLDRAEAALASAGLTLDEVPELGLPPGTAIPSFAATAVTGEEISPQTLGATGTPALLLFTSPHCGPCATLMPAVAAWQQEHVERLSIVLASSGSEDDVREEATRHGLTHVLHDRDHELYERFQANGTPSAVLLSPDGTIASWVASGADWIEQLVEHIVAEPERGGLPIGADAPALELPSLAGEKVSLASLRGREALLLFWNPDCGFCRALRDDVLTWEASADGDTPRLVIVSSGDAERTRADGFRSLVLLDEGFAAGAAFDAKGTPMAVLLDAEGRVASPVAAGADQVRSTVVELAAPRR